ncbi:MAG: hypothetical protein PHW04_09765 [Candidatus Wallbacteria bacterium]|nr:hypothetical protein [Candidatus Wallbacteria bacterium]
MKLTDEMKREMLEDMASQSRRYDFERLRRKHTVPVEVFLDFCSQWHRLLGGRFEHRKIKADKNLL